jgi:hypothetical protein
MGNDIGRGNDQLLRAKVKGRFPTQVYAASPYSAGFSTILMQLFDFSLNVR